MIGRIIDVASDGVHLATERGFMTVSKDRDQLGQVALDDIAALIVHGHGITYSANLTTRLAERGTPVVFCAPNHTPIALLWPMDGHYEQGRRMQAQAEAGKSVRKRLWQHLVKAKVLAQANALEAFGQNGGALKNLAAKVRSGDPENIEAQAARRYWSLMMGTGFKRDRDAKGANAMLNYGYMVLRAATARSILAAGLHPSLSIFHQSRGTALRLADDLMEPFRPRVDEIVKRLINNETETLDREAKAALTAVTTLDLEGTKGVSPLQTGLDRLATSLAQVYLGERNDLELPGPTPALFASPVLA